MLFSSNSKVAKVIDVSKTASHIRWHKEKCLDDGISRHPADAKVWKSFDTGFSNFVSDARNVRLG